jgi:pentatricopeptide repeat protein
MRARRPERALDMYTYMLAAGIQPNFTTYSYLVESMFLTRSFFCRHCCHLLMKMTICFSFCSLYQSKMDNNGNEISQRNERERI